MRKAHIGAVRLCNHKAVDEWYILINPQLPIPCQITQLTGITNEMVRNAPVFAKRRQLLKFMGDGVFVGL